MNVFNDLVSAIGHRPGNMLRGQKHSYMSSYSTQCLGDKGGVCCLVVDLVWPILATVKFSLLEICWLTRSVREAQSLTVQHNLLSSVV